MRNVLVTGGAGFIGSNFVRWFLDVEPNARVVTLDALTYAGSLENLRHSPDEDRNVFVHGSICDRELVESLVRGYQIDTIIHFAAETHVDRSIEGPSPFIQTNVVGTFTLLEAARKAWLEDGIVPVEAVRFHHVSTDEVYGSLGPDDPPFNEASPYAPSSPYAASKAASDHLVRAYARSYGLPVTITNCTNNYGPYQFPEKLVPLMILNAVEGRSLPVYGDGRNVRDWLYVDDHSQAIWLVLKHGRIGDTYNLGGGTELENIEVVRLVCRILDERLPDSGHIPHESLIRHVADRPGHDRRYAMDTSKIERELGWYPRESIKTGLAKTIDWYLAHPEWIASIRNRPEYRQWLERNYSRRPEVP